MATLTDRDAVVCGDWNIAHTENDIKNWPGRRGSGAAPRCRRSVLVVVVARKGIRQ
jgi:exodeoxyribonuclease-3